MVHTAPVPTPAGQTPKLSTQSPQPLAIFSTRAVNDLHIYGTISSVSSGFDSEDRGWTSDAVKELTLLKKSGWRHSKKAVQD